MKQTPSRQAGRCSSRSASLLARQRDAQQAPPPAAAKAAPSDAPALEPKAIEILKAASARLAAARSMSFTAVVTYESPSRLGPPLVYTTRSEVTLQRPDKLRVITPGDGPASEFYYDGKTMMAFAPAENLVAVADAPPTIDAALKAAYDAAAIYFPFTDVIVADPYAESPRAWSSPSTSANPAWSAARRRTWWRTSAMACSCRSGSAPTTSCRGWPARCSSAIRCSCATRWSSPTGRSIRPSRRAPSRRRGPPARSASRSPARTRSPRQAPRRRRRAGQQKPVMRR